MSFFYNLKASFIDWASNIRVYLGGIVLFGDSHYKVKGNHIRDILDILEPGDVLLRRYDHYLGSKLIPGYWSHAAFYVGNNKVLHMLGEGMVVEDILTFTRCDNICVLRCDDKIKTDLAVNKAVKYVFKESQIPYDYDFDNETLDKFYCTELVDNLFSYPIRKKIGSNKPILPDYLLDCEIFNEKYTVYNK